MQSRAARIRTDVEGVMDTARLPVDNFGNLMASVMLRREKKILSIILSRIFSVKIELVLAFIQRRSLRFS